MAACVNFILVVIASAVVFTTAVAASKRPADVWGYYHFDGVSFKAGPPVDGSAFIAVSERLQPVVLHLQTQKIQSIGLPEGAGAVAGICYIQSSGGKLGDGKGYVPRPRANLQISSPDTPPVVVQTDDYGYFITVLPAGKYTIGSGPFTDEISVQRGSTTLVPLRAGKRMVD
jgi:hypothetical protein